MRVIPSGFGTPIKIDTAAARCDLSGFLLSNCQVGFCENVTRPIADSACMHFKRVFAWAELETGFLRGEEKVVIGSQSIFANKQPASASQVTVTVDPNIESLTCFGTKQRYIHMLNELAAL